MWPSALLLFVQLQPAGLHVVICHTIRSPFVFASGRHRMLGRTMIWRRCFFGPQQSCSYRFSLSALQWKSWMWSRRTVVDLDRCKQRHCMSERGGSCLNEPRKKESSKEGHWRKLFGFDYGTVVGLVEDMPHSGRQQAASAGRLDNHQAGSPFYDNPS